VALQERIRSATEELRLRNEEIVQDYHRILSLREALGRAEQLAAVDEMAANVAHQIGTPLNLISGYVQLMKEHPGVDRRASSVCGWSKNKSADSRRWSGHCSIIRGNRRRESS
jgi:signal transduction histidine kinase